MLHEVVAAIIVRPQKILLGQRSASREFYPGVWDVLGGHVEPGEEKHEALIRELQEEIGITPTQWTFLETFNIPPRPKSQRRSFCTSIWSRPGRAHPKTCRLKSTAPSVGSRWRKLHNSRSRSRIIPNCSRATSITIPVTTLLHWRSELVLITGTDSLRAFLPSVFVKICSGGLDERISNRKKRSES